MDPRSTPETNRKDEHYSATIGPYALLCICAVHFAFCVRVYISYTGLSCTGLHDFGLDIFVGKQLYSNFARIVSLQWCLHLCQSSDKQKCDFY